MSKQRRNSIPRAVTNMYRQCGVPLVRAKDGDQHKIGIHLNNPSKHELMDSLEVAIRDAYPAVYAHYDNTPSDRVLADHLATKRRASFRLIMGGAA